MGLLKDYILGNREQDKKNNSALKQQQMELIGKLVESGDLTPEEANQIIFKLSSQGKFELPTQRGTGQFQDVTQMAQTPIVGDVPAEGPAQFKGIENAPDGTPQYQMVEPKAQGITGYKDEPFTTKEEIKEPITFGKGKLVTSPIEFKVGDDAVHKGDLIDPRFLKEVVNPTLKTQGALGLQGLKGQQASDLEEQKQTNRKELAKQYWTMRQDNLKLQQSKTLSPDEKAALQITSNFAREFSVKGKAVPTETIQNAIGAYQVLGVDTSELEGYLTKEDEGGVSTWIGNTWNDIKSMVGNVGDKITPSEKPKSKPKAVTPTPSTDKVIVQDAQGKKYRLPSSQLQQAIQQGYSLVQ